MSTGNTVRRPLDAHLEPALRFLASEGPPTPPTHLDLQDASWGGGGCPDITRIEVTEAGELLLEAEPPSKSAVVDDPAAWTPQVFTSTVLNQRKLVIDQGLSHVVRARYGAEGATITTRLHGFAWRVTGAQPSSASLWVAALRFVTLKAPRSLWFPRGNVVIRLGDRSVWCWRFETPNGLVFLVPDEDRENWSIAFETPVGMPPDIDVVSHVLAVIGFVMGEPLGISVLQAVGDAGGLPELVHLGLADMRRKEMSSQPPALPFGVDPEWLARFVELALHFMKRTPDAPALVAMHLYFAAVDGFVDSQFLLSWIATETLSNWAIATKTLRDGGKIRIADHVGWMAWVKAHATEIRAFAVTGMENQLVDRVRSSEDDRPTTVQRVFMGEGILWTPEMADAQLIRNGVAHDGAIPGPRPRNWDQDLARVGLAKTMLTAMIAKLIGYDGPIADRSRTCFSITSRDEPPWWPPGQLAQRIVYASLKASPATS